MRPGTELRQARERLGLTAQQIADRTKIQLHKIEALENDDFTPLPEGIYLDGIVRAYAHEVGVNPEPLIDRVRQQRAQSDIAPVESDDLDGFPVERDGFPGEREVVTHTQTPRIPTPVVSDTPAPAVHDRFDDPVDLRLNDDLRSPRREFEPPQPLRDLRSDAIEDELPPVEPAPRPIAMRPTRSSRRGLGPLVLALLLMLAVAGWVVYQREHTLRPQTSTTVEIGPSAPPPATSRGTTRAEVPESARAAAGRIADARPDGNATRTTNATQPTNVDTPTGAQTRNNDAGTARAVTGTSSSVSRNRGGRGATVAQPQPPTDAAVPAESAGTAATMKDVSGSWTLATRIESTSYARYQGLQLGYELQLEQVGDRVKGAGRKVVENGDGVGSRAQTPISVAGTIEGDRLTLTFNEIGARRPTQGKLVLMLDEADTLRGRFSSTAAHSSGTAEAHRLRR
jgi:cytoskeletal protein RodZ